MSYLVVKIADLSFFHDLLVNGKSTDANGHQFEAAPALVMMITHIDNVTTFKVIIHALYDKLTW
jgi:hypothetical protein